MKMSRTNQLVAAAAQRLGVAWASVGSEHSDWLLRLSWGESSCVISKTRSPFLTQVAQTLANNKRVSRELVGRLGIPVVPSLMVDESMDAAGTEVQGFVAEYGRVVVKPNSANRARGVVADLTDLGRIAAAIDRARELDADEEALVEPHIDGTNVRVAVIAGRFVAAAEIHRPILHGGVGTSIAQWVAQLNEDPRRGSWARPDRDPLDRIDIDDDDVVLALAGHGLDVGSVLDASTSFELLGEEAETIDVTDVLHRDWQRMAEQACAELGVDVGGVDFRMTMADVRAPAPTTWIPRGPALLEVNVSPALHVHALPTRGTPRAVYDAFVAYCVQQPGAPEPCAIVRAGQGR